MHFYRLFIAFVLSLLALAVVPLCYSSTLIDRHHFDGHKLRIEINEGTDPQQEVNQWQLSLLLPEGFNDQNSVLCFKTPVVPADSNSIALPVTNNLSNYCYQLVIMNGEQTPVFQQASKNGTLVRLKSTTADRPELASVNTHPPLSSKPHTPPLTLLAYTENLTDRGLETVKTRNNTRTLTGDKLAGNVDLSGGGNGGFFYLPPPPPWRGGGGWPTGLFEIDLVVLQPVISWLLSIGKDSASLEEQPSPTRLKITRVNADGSSSEADISVGWLDFLNSEQLTDVHFWNTLFQRGDTSCPASENLQWQLNCLKLFLERTALKTDHAGGLKAGNGDGEPSGRVPDKESKDEDNHHQKEQRFEPEGQESRSSGEGNEDREGGDDSKDDNGEESEKKATTQDLQELANQLIAIIESDVPDAVFKLGQILDELDMPQRLQVLETEGTNNRGTPVTPLEAVLELPRSFKEGSLRNRFIEQLIESTTDKTRTLNDFNIPSALQKIPLADQALSEAGDNNLSILSKIVQDIIRRVNQSDTQPPMGDFEKSCLTEHFVQLFLLYENPFGTIYELLGKISDVTIIRDVVFCAHPFTYSSTFQEIFTRFEQHPSYFNFVRYSNSLMMLLRSFPATKEPSQREPSLQKLSLQKPVISNNDNASNGTMARGCSASDERQSLFSSDSTSNETIVSGGFASDECQSGCNSNNTSSETMASHGNTLTHTIRPFNSASGSGTSSLKTSTDKYLLQGAKPKQPARTDRSNDSSQMRSYSLRSYGDHQSNLTQDQFGWEVPGINPNFLRKHSNDHSLLVDQPHLQNASPARRSATPRLPAATPLINPGNTFNADGSPEIHEPQNLDRSLEKLKHVVIQFQRDRRDFERYRNIREKEEQKRQQINELTAQIQWLTTQNQWLTSQNQWLITENQELNLEKQNLDKENQNLHAANQNLHAANQNLNAENRNLNAENQNLNAENQELTIKNQELDRDNQGLRGCVECYETDIGRLEAELQITRDELIQHRLHDRAHQAYHQMAERRPERCNCAMHRASRATTIQNEATNPLNEQASSSSGQLELTSASNITSGEYLPTAAASPVMPGNGGSLAPQPLNTFNEQLTPSNVRSVLSNEELQRLPEQESRRSVCEHFQRFCYVGFDCCPGYFPCHRCHNDRGSCKAELKAVHAIRFMCSICGYEGEITEDSQTCPNCEEQMSEYYCAKCKHFTSKYNDPFHCHKCGICRMKASESFHCDVCGVCMHKMLEGNHKCRPGSAHDRCGICLEDAFSGCQILPCSHKIHKHCAIAMLRNGIRTCPVCRGPVFTE